MVIVTVSTFGAMTVVSAPRHAGSDEKALCGNNFARVFVN
jgi:hypothetical protein